MLTEENLQVLKDFSTATLLKDMAPYLSMDYRQAELDYSTAKDGITPMELPEAAKDDVEDDLGWSLVSSMWRNTSPRRASSMCWI